MLAAMRRTSSRVSSFDRDQCRKTAWRLLMAHARASGRAVLAEPHNAVKVSTACPSSLGLFLLCRSLPKLEPAIAQHDNGTGGDALTA